MRAIGIDLGNTYSCVATIGSSGLPEVVPNSKGNKTTPSVVWFDNNRIVVGDEAKEMAHLSPESVAMFIKHAMGADSYRFSCSQGDLRPEEISAYIFKKLVQDASARLGEAITHAVITIPAYFGPSEQHAILNAASIADIKILQIISEPMAAAIAYINNTPPSSQPKHLLLYDLGGAGFNVTVIRSEAQQLQVICTGGDDRVGGKAWDERLVSIMMHKILTATDNKHDIFSDSALMRQLQHIAEHSKIALSSTETITERLTFNGNTHRLSITRDEFERETGYLLDETIQLTKGAISTAQRKGIQHIDELILVGGSTRMPQVAKQLKDELGMEPKMFAPEEAIAMGAALVAQSLILDM